MKLLHLALLAMIPTLLPNAAKAETHKMEPAASVRSASENHFGAQHNPAGVTAAIEPASFLLVGFGLLGGGVLRRRSLLEARKGQ